MNLHTLAVYLLTAGGVTFFISLIIYYYEWMCYLARRDQNLRDSAKEARDAKN